MCMNIQYADIWHFLDITRTKAPRDPTKLTHDPMNLGRCDPTVVSGVAPKIFLKIWGLPKPISPISFGGAREKPH